jgi:hypothetical protein
MKVLCMISLYDQRSSGFLAYEINIISSKNLCFYTHSIAYKKSGAPDRRSFIQQKVYTFTRVAPLTKSQGSRSTVPYSAKVYSFYTCSTAYKKPGAPNRRSLIQQKIMIFIHVAPRTKSNGLPIGGPLISKKTYAFYTCSTAYKKQGGSRSTLHTSSITFSTCFAAYKK